MRSRTWPWFADSINFVMVRERSLRYLIAVNVVFPSLVNLTPDSREREREINTDLQEENPFSFRNIVNLIFFLAA